MKPGERSPFHNNRVNQVTYVTLLTKVDGKSRPLFFTQLSIGVCYTKHETKTEKEQKKGH